MPNPSSQIIAAWVKEEARESDWTPLADVCLAALRAKLPTKSVEELSEITEANLVYVADYLREQVADCSIDGVSPAFDIDNEQRPYIRARAFGAAEVMTKLRRIDPFEFEKVCASVLEKLGAQAHATKRTNDGGVDFKGVGLTIVPKGFSVPAACRAAVIGQAKRYKDGNPVREVQVREFVGAALLARHELHQQSQFGPLAPVLCAFWTTFDFDPNAKTYARAVGLWYMDGRTMAEYVDGLGLRDLVLSLPDAP